MENLGKIAKDKITGFEGIVTSKHIYLTGSAQYGLQKAVDKEGNIPKVKFFDEGRLEIVCDFREHH